MCPLTGHLFLLGLNFLIYKIKDWIPSSIIKLAFEGNKIAIDRYHSEIKMATILSRCMGMSTQVYIYYIYI